MNKVKPRSPNRESYGRQIKKEKIQVILKKIREKVSLEYLEEAKRELTIAKEMASSFMDIDTGYQIAHCYYHLFMYKESIDVLTSIKPSEDQKRPRVLNLKSLCYLRMGNLLFAKELLDQALIIDPCDVETLNNLGNIAMHKGEFDNCKAYYRRSKIRILS